MAVRDRNLSTWQAYVLTMSFVSVLLLLGMFFLWRTYSDLSRTHATMTEELGTTQEAALKSEARVRRLQSMLGYGTNTPADLESMRTAMIEDPVLAEVEKKFGEHMKLFDPTVPEAERNYVTLPVFLLDTIRQRNNEIVQGRIAVTKLQKERDDVVKRETAARAAADAEKAKAIADLDASRSQHAEQMAASDAAKTDILNKYQAYEAKYNAEVVDLKKVTAELVADKSNNLNTIEQQAQKIVELSDQDFAAAQGMIVSVSLGTRTVWINLGSEDGLREGIPFSVIDNSELKISEGVVKGKLVVTKVVGDHLAQAKITSSNFTRPIVPEDLIFSPVWRSGRKVGFALVGLLDMNNDGINDRQSIVDLIQSSGGQVDAEIDTDGKISGPGMTVNTAYLIMGTDTITKANATPQQLAKAQAYGKFITEGKSFGIQQISIDKLIGFLRARREDRTVPLSNQIRAADFPATSINPGAVSTSRGSVSEIFEQRRPGN